ncbi:MAG: hypothetical protein A2020_08240 [Lentisphaerae bacterium GWF2_45_14]|nr:MAG: hypothetical protein A2020_08240 [Lentisphaerae bacterium GWF2_45_14]
MTSIHKEIAVQVGIFEKLFKCNLSFHDYTGTMRKNLTTLNFAHLNRFCASVKKFYKHDSCISFDFNLTQSELFSSRKTFFKVCQAGVIELVVPIFIKDQLSGAMFAGPFRISDGMPSDIFGKPGSISRDEELKKIYERLPCLKAFELEALKCFAQLFVRNLERYALTFASGCGVPSGRAERIKFFIENNFRKSPSLSDLAKYMGLSVPRISQLLNEFFGKGISALVMEEKIKHAERLLCNSYFTMEAISGECGFSCPSYFFKVFKRLRGCPPAEFRRNNPGPDYI